MEAQAKRFDMEERLRQLRSEWTETEKVILSRRSVRLYRKEQVPAFMVKRILEAGRFAPSAGNCQPWKFVVLRDPLIIQGLTRTTVDVCGKLKSVIDYRRPGFKWLRPFSKALIRIRHNDLHPVPFGAMSLIADGRLGLWHGAPTVILVFKDVRGASSPDLDCGIAGQNMVLAAHSMGLGTCWVGFAKLAFQYSRKWTKRLDIHYPYEFMTSLSVGWPKGEPDGMVARQTHPVDWYENGTKQTLFPCTPGTERIHLRDRLLIPTYDDPDETTPGEITFDIEACSGCTFCKQVCPADTIVVENNRPRLRPWGENQCIFCGDCMAICPESAIRLTRPYSHSHYFRTLDTGKAEPPRLCIEDNTVGRE
jgi:nitroreductase/ferredoxin